MAQSTSSNLSFREVGYVPTISTNFPLSRVGHMGTVRVRDPTVFQTVNARAETFLGWNGALSASEMYEAGFIYRNLRDQVQCVYCLTVIEEWKWFHSAISEHRGHSPTCSFIVGNGDNLALDITRAGLFPDPSQFLESTSGWNSESTADEIEETPEPSTNDEEESSNNEEAPSSATDTSLCKICYVKEMCILFLPCAHLLSCSTCAKRVQFCALCREPIQQTIRAFISFS